VKIAAGMENARHLYILVLSGVLVSTLHDRLIHN
jgi:hypothetical protein